MRQHVSQRVFSALLFAVAALSPSCASRGTAADSLLGLSVAVERCADREISARLLDLDGDLYVHGNVRARRLGTEVPGHGDLVVRTADGAEWASGQASYRSPRRSAVRGGPSQSVFDVASGGRPPAGSSVTLRHHGELHGERSLGND